MNSANKCTSPSAWPTSSSIFNCKAVPYSSPVHGFPMCFTPRHAPIASLRELLSNLVYSRSGGDPVFLIDDLLSVAELDVVDDQFELPESLDALPPRLGALQQLEDHRQGGLA